MIRNGWETVQRMYILILRVEGLKNYWSIRFPSGWKCYKTISSNISYMFIEIWSTWEVWRALKKLELLLATPRATLTRLWCSPNFLHTSYLNERMLTHEPIVKYYIIVFSAFLGNLGKSVLLSVWFLVSGVPDPCQLCVTDIYSDDLLPVMCWGRRKSLHFGG